MNEASMVREAAQARIEELEDKHYSECAQIARYDDGQNKRDTIIQSLLHTIEEQKAEIAALKRLLRLAVVALNDDCECGRCVYGDHCQANHDFKCVYMWKYTVEAEKLLSDSEVHHGSD